MKHKAEATSIAERICKERDYTSMSASELQTFFDNCKSKFDETETDSMEEAFYEKVCDTIACEFRDISSYFHVSYRMRFTNLDLCTGLLVTAHAGIYFDGSK